MHQPLRRSQSKSVCDATGDARRRRARLLNAGDASLTRAYLLQRSRSASGASHGCCRHFSLAERLFPCESWSGALWTADLLVSWPRTCQLCLSDLAGLLARPIRDRFSTRHDVESGSWRVSWMDVEYGDAHRVSSENYQRGRRSIFTRGAWNALPVRERRHTRIFSRQRLQLLQSCEIGSAGGRAAAGLEGWRIVVFLLHDEFHLKSSVVPTRAHHIQELCARPHDE